MHKIEVLLLRFFKTRYAAVLSAVLVVQAAGYYSFSHPEKVPPARPLTEFPTQFQDWAMIRQGVMDPEVQQILRADDTVNREYASSSRRALVDLFIAYFRSQRQGQAPHSPQNCMPGSGWMPVSTAIIPVSVPGREEPIRINRYVLSKGSEKSVVLYWYQSNRRVIASEYIAKIYLVADAIRYNRTDTALVRVLVPVSEHGSEDGAAAAGVDFIRSFFSSLRDFLPS